MLELSQDSLDQLARLIADRVADKLSERENRVLIDRKELAAITGLGERTIDRMARGGSMEKDRKTEAKVWRPSAVCLTPIRVGGRVMFDKAAALAAIKQIT